MSGAVRLLAPLGPEWRAYPAQELEQLGKVINTCGCGRSFTFAEFRALEEVGRTDMGQLDGVEPAIAEQRLCICGSTRAIWTTSAGEYCEEAVGVKRS